MRLGRFELLGRLGRGGMGEVWRALDPRLSREVAVKVLPEGLAADPEWVGRFEREARALAALSHPNVAQIYEIGDSETAGGESGLSTSLRFLVMELIEGVTLRDRIKRGRLPYAEAIGIAQQVARALVAAHARGVIHRDLKPANLMLAADGTVKVLDFGLARLQPNAESSRETDITLALSRPGTVLGTAAYMAPEQMRGEECDDRCDVWAFGCCLAEMLTGQRLFGDGTVREIAERVLAASADTSSLDAVPPGAARELLAACLRPERNDRPRMEEVARRLDELARLPGPRPRRRWLRRVVAAVGLVVAASALVLLAGKVARQPKVAPSAMPGPLRVALPRTVGATPIVARLSDALTRALATDEGVEIVSRGTGDVGVVVEAAPGQGSEAVRVSLLGSRDGAVEAVVERRIGRAGAGADLDAVVASVVDAIDRLAVVRRLDAKDALHGFLARRARTAAAARAFERGVSLYGRTRRNESAREFAASLAAEPGFWPAHLYLAQVAASTSRFAEGRAELAAARAALPRPDAVESAVLEVVAAMMMDDNQRLAEALTQARAAFPTSGELLYRSAWAYRQLGRPAEAIPLLEKLVAAGWQPDWSPTWVQLAYCQLLDGRVDAATDTARDAERRFPQNPNFPYVLAMAGRLRGDDGAAREAMARAIRKREDYSATDPLALRQSLSYWCGQLGWQDERNRQLTLWLAEADRQLAARPGDEEIVQQKAGALDGLGRFAEARALVEPLSATTRDPYVLIALARACFGLGDRAAGRNAVERAGALWRAGTSPALGGLAYNIGCAAVAGGDLDAGLRWIERAAEQHGFDRLDLLLDPDLAPLRNAGLLARFGVDAPGTGHR